MALLFYVVEYATRSSPAVMLPQLSTAFGETALGVSGLLGAYYYTYSFGSLVAGAALDRIGPRVPVVFGAGILGIGCLLFTVADPASATVGRLLQGAGSSFAFTGAVFLASRGFSPQTLATAIGATQCLGMLGGSAGQFVVGPLLGAGISWSTFWIVYGVAGLALAALLFLLTPGRVQSGVGTQANVASAYATVLRNPQTYLCGIISGLLFTPTTIGDMTWGVAFLQHDTALSYGSAVTTAALVPLGWVFGCPLLGWLADRSGLRKPVLIGGTFAMLIVAAQITWLPQVLPIGLSMILFGVASGTAMIPYTIVKEANPDEVKGCATGMQNFLVFGLSALVGPLFAHLLGQTLTGASDPLAHFRQSGVFWMGAILLALLASLVVGETGRRRTAGPQAEPALTPSTKF